ncbi:hypothetical protein [Pseudomonas putida]
MGFGACNSPTCGASLLSRRYGVCRLNGTHHFPIEVEFTMTDLKSPTAEQTRQSVIKARREAVAKKGRPYLTRRALAGPQRPELPIATLDPAVIAPPLVPSDPGDEINLLLNRYHDAPLVVSIPLWNAGSNTEEYLSVFVNDIAVIDNRQLAIPHDPAEFEVTLPARFFASEGVHTLWYSYINDVGNPKESIETVVTIDKTPPGNNAPIGALIFPPEVVANGITAEYLGSHNDEVVASVPAYLGAKRGDYISWYWGTTPPSDEDLPDGTTAGLIDVNAPVTITIPGDVIRAKGAGQKAAPFVIHDRANNIREVFGVPYFPVELLPPPFGLLAPEVPLAEDGLIDLGDAQLGVEVVIPDYQGYDPSDYYQVEWDGIVQAITPITTPSFTISWATLSRNGLGPRAVIVKYYVKRTATSLVRYPSPELTVNVDFRAPGPDPIVPGPNPLLLPVTVRGGAWQTGDPDNKLTIADRGQPATATVELAAKIEDGDILTLRWGTFPGTAATVTINGESEGDVVTFPVPWNVINQGGFNEFVRVDYTVSRPGLPNAQLSMLQLVDARISQLEGLPNPVLPAATTLPNGRQVLNCASKIWDGIVVNVPGDGSVFSSGDRVVCYFQGYSDANNTTPILNTDKEFVIPSLTPAQAINGFSFTITPYTGMIELVSDGSADIYYRLFKADGQEGSSLLLQPRVSRRQGETFCTP